MSTKPSETLRREGTRQRANSPRRSPAGYRALERPPQLDESERERLEAWNATAQPYPAEKCIHELFEEQVALTPDAVALVCEKEQLTYAQLNERANQLAHHLIERGVAPDVPVALCVERSAEMVVGLLAVLKAGGAYVPLDPAYPRERLRYMLQDSKPALLLLLADVRVSLGDVLSVPSVDLQADSSLWSRCSRANPQARSLGVRSDHLAYIIYTSGSTGRPKGVMNEHRPVVNRLHWMQQEYSLSTADRVLQKTPFSFDVSVWELFWPLLNGVCLVMARPEGHKDPYYLGELIEQERITVVHFVPSMLRSFLACEAVARCRSLRYVMCSGEELPAGLQNQALKRLPQASLHNLYGPTEAAIDVTYWACREQPPETRVPIGRPIANTQIYILGRHRAPVPLGATGEIYIGGAGVARGYLNRPELTAERFLPDPFSPRAGARMYRTGDLGRWRDDGSIEYLGRTDAQVKIHGFRIELGEIEAALRQQPGVGDAVVIAREDSPGEKRLVAYLCGHGGKDISSASELRAALQQSLPAHMVPATFVKIDSLPLTPNGKLDRVALSPPTADALECAEYEPPQGEVEEALADIWQQLLRLPRVGRRDNFFALGGNSLLALSLIDQMRRRGMRVDLHPLFTHADLARLAEAVAVGEQELVPRQNDIPHGCERITPEMLPLIVLEQCQIDQIVAAVPGGAANVQDIYPLAPLQQGILFHHLVQEQGDPYVLSSLLAFQSARRLQEFVAALQAVIDRHDILRTGIAWERLPEPVQVVWRKAPLSLRTVSLLSQDGPKELWERFDPRRHRLDVRRAPLFEAIRAYDTPGDRWLLLLLFHHLATDHTSLEVIFAEVRAHLHGQQQQLPAPVPFKTFVAQAQRALSLREHEAFFTAMLGGIDEPTAPFGLLDAQGDGSGILEAQRELDAGLAREIRGCARAHRVSVASLYHLAWAQVLARLTGREKVVFGTVLFGRMQAEEGPDRALGLFINTLPIAVSLPAEKSVQEAVRTTHERLIQLLRHEHASLVTAQRCSAVAAPTPLFTTVLNYRYSQTPSFEQVNRPALEGMQVLRSEERSNYPIALSVDDLGEGFRLTAQAHAALAPERLCKFVQRAMEELVRALIQEPHKPIRTIDVLPDSERQQLASWNVAQGDFPQERCIHELFEEQVARTPDAIAVVCEEQQLTYAELSSAANRLAHYLRECGVKPDVRVAVCAQPSLELVIGLLGILKAGGAYVPLDPGYPRERLRYMLQDSEPALVLLHGDVRAALGAALTAPSVDLQADAVLWQGYSPANAQAAAVGLRCDHLAYVIYTSGSTGQPKGVMGEHRGMVNRIAAQRWIAPFAADDVCSQKTSIGFVDSIFEILGPLCHGRPLMLAPQSASRDSLQLARFVQRKGITRLISVPSLAEAFLASDEAVECLQGLRGWSLSGEEIRGDLLVRLRSVFPNCRFLNLYGSSEVAADATWCLAEDFKGSKVPIGRPIHNTQVYLLDDQSRPVPIGATGEIHVGGVGVARGYLNRPELTAERFLADPFSSLPGARMYRTGDMARYLPDGNLEFLGRNDQQVKIRGFRIELGEIEAHLTEHPVVREAVVLAREDRSGEKRLVAYFICDSEADVPPEAIIPGLRAHLAARVPDYMVPAAFVRLDALPLSPNGKLDRKALPAPGAAAFARKAYEPPQGHIEQTLASLWGQLLGVSRISRHDNFFELGGHSLLAVQLMERLRRLGLSTDVRAMFAAPTLVALAATLGSYQDVRVPENVLTAESTALTAAMLPLIDLTQTDIDRIVAQVPGGLANIQDIYALSPLQDGILFHHVLATEGDPYLLIRQMVFPGRALLDRYLEAMQHIVDRHDILRTAFFWEQLSRPAQVVLRRAPLTVIEVALEPEGGPPLEQLTRRFDPRRPRISLSKAPLLHFIIAQEPRTERWLVVQLLHHLIGDRSTLETLHSEVQGILAGRADTLPNPLPFRDFIAQARLGVSPQEHERFFRDMLADIVEPTAPFGLLDVHRDGSQVTQSQVMLPGTLHEQLRAHARRLGVSVASLCHLAWGQVIARCSGRSAVVFGTVLFGRMHAGNGADRAMGLFINTLPLRIDLDETGIQESVRHTHARLGELLRHEHASLALAQRCSGVVSPAPLFSALLNYRHNQLSPAADANCSDDHLREVQWLGGEERTNYPVILSVEDSGHALGLTAQVLSPFSPERLCNYMKHALGQLVHALDHAPHAPVNRLEVLPPEERTLLLETWNQTDTAYPHHLCIHQLFEQQVERAPDATALVYDRLSLTYAELNAQANRLAHHLIALGVRPDEPVAVCLERSPAMIVSLLAILKAGGAYVPLDPTYPSERLAQILSDAAVRVLLCDECGSSVLGERALASLTVLDLTASSVPWAQLPPTNPDAQSFGLTSRHLAYIMYTSGSAGTPKGVMVPHQAVNRLVINNYYCGFGPNDRIAFASNPAFDVSTMEIWGALLNGGLLVVIDQQSLLAPDALVQTLQLFRVTKLWLTVGLFNRISVALVPLAPQLESLIIGGDVLDPSVISHVLHQSPPRQLINGYGPTETTTFATTYEIKEARAGVSVPIGRPIANTRIYLLDANREPVPLGAIGEIYIGGAGVARGYLNRPDLTAERFLPDPFSPHPGARMYRTGDLARYLPDGNLVFCGRNDQQVKIRGFRIEPAEIEAHLTAHPAIREAAVIAREERPGEKRLVAYVTCVPGSALCPAQLVPLLRTYLAARLPEYMLPAGFVHLPALPLTPNGKLDRKALPAPDSDAFSRNLYEPPHGPTEHILALLWEELLGVSPIGRHDNFFELGGHSLSAIQLLYGVHSSIPAALTMADLFSSPSLKELAATIDLRTRSISHPIAPLTRAPDDETGTL